MEKFITNKSLYLMGPIKDVLGELRRLANEHKTVQDYINTCLN